MNPFGVDLLVNLRSYCVSLKDSGSILSDAIFFGTQFITHTHSITSPLYYYKTKMH